MVKERNSGYGIEFEEEIDKVFKVPEVDGIISVKNRIFVTGTNYEIRVLRDLGFGNRFEGKEVNFSSTVDNFWKGFFGVESLADRDSYSLPEKIITTGKMRAYVYFSETALVGERIKRVAEKFDVPVEFITSFAH